MTRLSRVLGSLFFVLIGAGVWWYAVQPRATRMAPAEPTAAPSMEVDSEGLTPELDEALAALPDVDVKDEDILLPSGRTLAEYKAGLPADPARKRKTDAPPPAAKTAGVDWSSVSTMEAPEQVFPAPGQSFNNFPRTTTFQWKPVPGARSYSIELDCFHCCEVGKWCTDVKYPIGFASELKETSYTSGWPGANLGRWRVWAVDAHGKPGYKSAWREFSYTK